MNESIHRGALALRVREHIIRMATGGGCFIGASLSCADLLVHLYTRVLRISPETLSSPDRDVLLLSKGHDVPALYGTLAELGYFPKERLQNHLKTSDSIYWHPNRDVPGIEFHSGSLGHCLSVGIGVALDAKLRGSGARTFVVLGDGECDEGSVWEALLVASAHKLDNLVAIVDRNVFQANVKTEDSHPSGAARRQVSRVRRGRHAHRRTRLRRTRARVRDAPARAREALGRHLRHRARQGAPEPRGARRPLVRGLHPCRGRVAARRAPWRGARHAHVRNEDGALMSYENTLLAIAERDPSVVVMTAENRAAIRSLPSKLGPRFIDVGICEQTMNRRRGGARPPRTHPGLPRAGDVPHAARLRVRAHRRRDSRTCPSSSWAPCRAFSRTETARRTRPSRTSRFFATSPGCTSSPPRTSRSWSR